MSRSSAHIHLAAVAGFSAVLTGHRILTRRPIVPSPGKRLRTLLPHSKTKTLIVALVSVLSATSSFSSATQEKISAPSPIKAEPIKPIPQSIPLDPKKVSLGRALFHEPKLSRDNSVSCATCHDLKKGGTDQREVALGIGQAPGTLNVPTVFNSGANFKQFWDGRSSTLEEQVDDPIHNPVEMGSNWNELLEKLRATPAYASAFQEIYPDGLNAVNVRNAIAEFERSLITPNSRFDRFLRGDDSAMTGSEKEGYRKFKSFGCASCHQGVNAGGNMFETLGAMADYFADRGGVTKADNGRFNVTGKEIDRFVFKVPSLRNIARTAPYLHDGSAKSLEKAVSVMAKYQLGRKLTTEDVEQIVQFLETLTGEYEGKPL